MTITLNGDPRELPGPMTVAALLVHLEIDPRRVAVEHNLAVLRRAAYDFAVVQDGDTVEVVNFVGGGATAPPPTSHSRRVILVRDAHHRRAGRP